MTAELSASLSRPELPPEGGRTKALLTITPGEQPRAEDRHVVLCLDESRSMEEPLATGEQPKMSHVRTSARRAIERLSESDHVGIVAFENTPTVATELQPLSAAGRDAVIETVEDLGPGGGTDILSALKLSRDELARYEGGTRTARRILLLSDGADRFEPETFEDLAEEIAADGTSIVAGGIGPDYDEEVMLAIADGSNGHATHLETADDITEFVAEGVGETDRLVAACPELELDVDPTFDFHEVYCRTPETKPRDVTDDAGSITVSLPDLLAGQQQTVVLEVLAPPREAGLSYDIADVTLRAGDEELDDATLTVEYVTDPETERANIAVKHEEARIRAKLRAGEDAAEVEEEIADLAQKADEETVATLRRKRDAVAEGESGSQVKAGLPAQQPDDEADD